MATLQHVKIFPSIGIARIGNSHDWYLGPELPFPALPPAPPGGRYKDDQCRIKRQAQLFRLWGYYSDNTSRELTSADGVIEWTVHLVNSKTSKFGEGTIDPGIRTLSGPGDDATFATGTFLGVEVPLGEAHTDEQGRLIVVGGFGNSATPTNPPSPLTFPNSKGWYDDISDGPVTAQITVGTTTLTADGGAWVICPPPRFAPTTYSITSLYDTIRQVALDNGSLSLPAQSSFINDIYPILKRALDMRYVTAFAFCDGDHDTIAALIPPGPGQLTARQAVFAMLNPPGIMPLLNGAAQIKPFQRTFLQRWSQGQSVDDWPPVIPTAVMPDGMTQAALESCVGAAFFPGIEATTNITTVQYTEPFRIDHAHTSPGDVTTGMSRPWQNDFYLCSGPASQVDCTETQGHHVDVSSWWPAARPIGVFAEADPATKQDWTRDLVSSAQDMVDNWSRLGFIVDKNLGKPLETERTVVCRDCFIVLDRSEIGKEEAQALIQTGQQILDAFYVVVEGFAPSDLHITSATPTPAQLQQWVAQITFSPQPSGMAVDPHTILLQNSNALTQPQRITFAYNTKFTTTGDFTAEYVPITITASIGGLSSSATIFLTTQPHPYMVHGPVSWLSNDTRVFKLQPGGTFAGATLGNDSNTFIQNVINQLRTVLTPAQAFTAFEGLPADEAGARLEWLPTLNNAPVYNFALCRVRYRATVTSATDVRVYFRLFQTASTGTDFNPNTTYRFGGQPGVTVPLLGIQGSELVTVPFFAEPRKPASVDLNLQTDTPNVHTINPDSSGQEVDAYFGCWLDINNPNDPRFPIHPTPKDGGPFTGPLLSIADLIRGTHQCMVAEIRFDPDPITPGVSTASSDKLSQRNLAIDHSDNPGTPPTHQVQHTFAIRPTAGDLAPGQRPDELMIQWGNTPPGTEAALYLPGLSANDVLALAGRLFDLQTLHRLDDHTLRCASAGVTYIPIPPGGPVDLAGLLTLDLPPELRRGQTFRILVRQVTDRPPTPRPQPPVIVGIRPNATPGREAERRSDQRHIIGAFQFSVQVVARADMLAADVRDLAALQRVTAKIPAENRWHPVMTRYLSQLAARVRALGGPRREPREREERIHYEGKISGLFFDRFGDFYGFELATEDGPRHFHTREPAMQRLARQAWQRRTTVRVEVEREDRDDPIEIVLVRSPAAETRDPFD